jgi:hypothetical protein
MSTTSVVWPVPRFRDDGDGTVTDHLTGLVWLQNANRYGEQAWTESLDATAALKDGDCGLSDGSVAGDWRVSNLKELQSLFDYDRTYPSIAAGHPFSAVRWSYASSTLGPRSPGEDFFFIWFAGFRAGRMGVTGLDVSVLPVWPVRGGPLSVVRIDIKPGGFPNSVNPYGRGVIPVAILGDEDFEVAEIDVTTLRFGLGRASPAHDLTDSFTYNDHLQDVNLDGFMDLVTHFRTRDTRIVCGDESVTLTGETLDGQPIEGSDSIRTVGCRVTRRPAIWMKDQDRPDTQRRDGPVNIERK